MIFDNRQNAAMSDVPLLSSASLGSGSRSVVLTSARTLIVGRDAGDRAGLGSSRPKLKIVENGLLFAGNRLQAVGETVDKAGKYCFALCG